MTNTPTITDTISVEKEVLDKIVEFPLGIPGFTEAHRFVFSQESGEKPFSWMRSLDVPEIAFAVVEAYYLVPDFSFEVDDRELEVIESPSPVDCAVFFLAKIELGEKLRIWTNCHAPILINTRARKGRQVTLPWEPGVEEPTLFEF